MQLIITIIIGTCIFLYVKYKFKKLYQIIDQLETKISSQEETKKNKDDIKTLFENQKMLLSLINAVRVRINNFYAKKLKEPKLKAAGFKSISDLGEE